MSTVIRMRCRLTCHPMYPLRSSKLTALYVDQDLYRGRICLKDFHGERPRLPTYCIGLSVHQTSYFGRRTFINCPLEALHGSRAINRDTVGWYLQLRKRLWILIVLVLFELHGLLYRIIKTYGVIGTSANVRR